MPTTRVFANAQAARDGILELEASGVDPHAMSIVTCSPRDAEALEHATGAAEDVEDASVHYSRIEALVDWLGKVESATVPSFGTVLGTGNLWQDVQVAGRGRGSITGALVGCGVPVDEASRLEDAVFQGQILIVVHDQNL